MENLSLKHCAPCKTGTVPLQDKPLLTLFSHLEDGWKVVEQKQLIREYPFKDFQDALTFVNKVGAIAEAEGHHPDIYLSWGKVKLIIWTHKIQGLSENDFILAAKCDLILHNT